VAAARLAATALTPVEREWKERMNPQRTPLWIGLGAAVFLLRAPADPPGASLAAAGQPALPITAALAAEAGAPPAAGGEAPGSVPPLQEDVAQPAWRHYARLFREQLDIEPPRPPADSSTSQVRGRVATQPLSIEISTRPKPTPVGKEDFVTIAKSADAAGDRLEFMIALVADPVDSRLAADFDLSLRALQFGLARADFHLERLWLPWAEPEAAEQKGYRDAAGLLLFRRDAEVLAPPATAPSRPGAPPAGAGDSVPRPDGSSRGASLLAVFLVGETPKLGIHKQAFHHAVDFILRLHARGAWPLPPCAGCPPPPEIPVLGPSYSGSADSLRLVLEDKKYSPIRFHVVSGSATAPDVRAHLTTSAQGDLASRVWFSRTVMRDDELAHTAFRFLHERLGWRLNHAALLIESDTVYGGHFLRDNSPDGAIPDEVKRIAFPSNLLALRNAWQQTAFGPPAAEAAKAPRAVATPKTALEVSLVDQGTPIDVVPELSPLTPRLGDMALSNLLRQLTRERIDYVGILATDVKDELFLAEQIRRWAPNVVLFVFDSNLLYVHPQYNATMFGTLAISSFPLVTEGAIPELSPAEKNPRYRRQFASAWQEGTYLAVRTLLGVDVPEPAIWISASGNYAMWPLVNLTAAPRPAAAATREPPAGYRPVEPLGPSSRTPGVRPGPLPPQPDPLPPEKADLALLALLALLWLASYALWQGGFSRAAAQLRTRWLLSGAAALLCLAGAGVVELWIGRLLWRQDQAAVGAWGFLLVLLAAYGVLVWVLVATASHYQWPRHLAAVFLVAGLLLPWVLWMVFTFGVAGGNRSHLGSALVTAGAISFHLRARAFAAGLSPLVPLAWLTAAAFFWAVVELKRHLVGVRHRAAWPLRYHPDPAFAGCDMEVWKLDQLLERTWPSSRRYRLAMLAVVAAPIVFLWTRLQPIGESRGYGRIVLFLVAMTSVFGLASFFRFVAAWVAVRRLLRRIAFSRLLPALERVAGTVDWKPTRFGWSGTSFTALSEATARLQTLIALGALPQRAGPESPADLLRMVLEAHGEGAFDDELAARRRLDDRFEEAYPLLAGERSQLVDDFFALRLIAYLRRVFNQLRYAVMSQFGTGLAVMAAIATYAFEPKRATMLIVWVALMAASAVSLAVFVQMDRDVALSAIGGTKSGKLSYDWAFFSNVLTYAVLPALGLIASQFPSMGRLLSSLLDPLTRVLGTG
jgi:hypothetical protein